MGGSMPILSVVFCIIFFNLCTSHNPSTSRGSISSQRLIANHPDSNNDCPQAWADFACIYGDNGIIKQTVPLSEWH